MSAGNIRLSGAPSPFQDRININFTLIFEHDRFSSGATQSRFASRWFENPHINVDRIVGGQQASNRYVWPFRALCLRLTFSTTQSECNISLFRFPNLFIAFFLPNRFETRPSLSCTVHLYHHPVCRHLHQKNGVKSRAGVVPFRLHLLLMKCTCVGFSGIYDLLLCVSAVEHLRSTIYKSGPWCRDVLEVRGATPGVTNP